MYIKQQLWNIPCEFYYGLKRKASFSFWCMMQQKHSYLNSLRPSDAICHWRSWSTLVKLHVMACCLMAPSHYLNQCWLIISEILRHSPEGNFAENAPGPRLNIKTVLSTYCDFHVKDKTVFLIETAPRYLSLIWSQAGISDYIPQLTLKMSNLKLQQHLPGANELIWISAVYLFMLSW